MRSRVYRRPEAIESFEPLLTAEEAFPAFEREMLGAASSVLMGFRVFDLSTKLRSEAALAVGETWFDLFEHTLSRGVDITLVLTDFDPVVATEYHRGAWATARQLAGAKEVAGRGTLTFRVARHPARAGLLPRLIFRRKVREMFEEAEADALTPGLRDVRRNDLFSLSPVTHHQKLAVFDRKRLYLGGLDLDERRFDTLRHDRPAKETWADVHAIVTGPVAEAAARHLETFEDVVAGRRPPGPPAPGFLRTLSAKRTLPLFRIAPRTVASEIEAAHLEAVKQATSLIYLETQFFRHKPLARALAAAARDRPGLHLMMVLPAAPESVAFVDEVGSDARMGEALQADAVEIVLDAFGTRALIASPVQPRRATRAGRDTHRGAPIIYVHSKVSVFDGTRAIISSANLNGRSLKWDTEAGIDLTTPAQVATLFHRLLSHWLPQLDAPAGTDGATLFSLAAQAVVEDADSAPEKRLGLLVLYAAEKARATGEHQPLAPNELV